MTRRDHGSPGVPGPARRPCRDYVENASAPLTLPGGQPAHGDRHPASAGRAAEGLHQGQEEGEEEGEEGAKKKRKKRSCGKKKKKKKKRR